LGSGLGRVISHSHDQNRSQKRFARAFATGLVNPQLLTAAKRKGFFARGPTGHNRRSDSVHFALAALTWTAHSSVATVLLVMSPAYSNFLTPAAAFALVLGANFGSAINSCWKAHINLAHVSDIIDENLTELTAKKIRRNFQFSDEGVSELAVF
jgi:hypothetical protein